MKALVSRRIESSESGYTQPIVQPIDEARGLPIRSTPSATVTKDTAGWGRFRPRTCHIYEPADETDLVAMLRTPHQPTCIPRGLGRSYGDAAVNGNAAVVSMARLDRIMAFSADLKTIECEAGVSLDRILQVILPHGLFLPVTPGLAK